MCLKELRNYVFFNAQNTAFDSFYDALLLSGFDNKQEWSYILNSVCSGPVTGSMSN